ncbi:arsenic resistance N-acetyltransferase ArsN2 [Rubellimicrobium aerolatum]|uniref:Arsenic resistance N-acetyltransferase ArsN2 n=1 Tax=Rubellimicrobium aerolatum TaxID=490979 RepID=A0ABW0SH71_9RHOB|nr:arsenic resistance N-acetyltransferase ArsN2 [Rubellimicrobium aerolatum]MBP1807758.1 N-acetylglutamate synthase-like GNAT family acetyltransferase [Rubellimicrobium aerolatum]
MTLHARPVVPLGAETIAGAAPDLRAPLGAERLPTDDLTEPGRTFLRLLREGATVGFGGYERHGDAALLRSLVVLPVARGQGLGRETVRLLLHRAAEEGARHAYLLTTSAAPFFERLGFARVERASAPEAIRASRQAASLCPTSAALMARPIDPEGQEP